MNAIFIHIQGISGIKILRDEYEKSSCEFMSDSECHICIFNTYV